MSKHKHSTGFRRIHNGLKKDIITIMEMILEDQPDNKVMLDDNRGSLVTQVIDDQESEVIQSIELIKYSGDSRPPCVVVWTGVFEEDNNQGVEDFEVYFLLNILEALEKAVE
jgi:hypothetical protein